jgi:hypothetical protein
VDGVVVIEDYRGVDHEDLFLSGLLSGHITVIEVLQRTVCKINLPVFSQNNRLRLNINKGLLIEGPWALSIEH